MKLLIFLLPLFIFLGCSKTPQVLSDKMPKTHLVQKDFSNLANWQNENHNEALNSFINSCKTKKTKKLYNGLCLDALKTKNAKLFLQNNFSPFEINTKDAKTDGLLTGYYEAQLYGSLEKTSIYKYPIYKTPKDLITVNLSSIYPNLKNYRLRGRLVNNKLIPYYNRSQLKHINSEIICYTDSKIDLFFLEIQGSGRVILENGKTIFISYANQNGHKYRAIGRYLINLGEIKKEDISLQSIKAWLEKNPSRVNEVLNYNKSLVFFSKSDKPATGSLGIELTPKRSIAVDPRYIPLGTMLYLDSTIGDDKFSKIVMAQDTGGAIKGTIRADLFLGYGVDATQKAGMLKSSLKLWVLLPKKRDI
ncbi:MAG: MltA domain-containing protein [Campylobacterota bacterium]|nr:MltA domain-containing protein [Campylobacterota bacterium]